MHIDVPLFTSKLAKDGHSRNFQKPRRIGRHAGPVRHFVWRLFLSAMRAKVRRGRGHGCKMINASINTKSVRTHHCPSLTGHAGPKRPCILPTGLVVTRSNLNELRPRDRNIVELVTQADYGWRYPGL